MAMFEDVILELLVLVRRPQALPAVRLCLLTHLAPHHKPNNLFINQSRDAWKEAELEFIGTWPAINTAEV